MIKRTIYDLIDYKQEVLARTYFAEKCLTELDELKRLIDIENEYATTPRMAIIDYLATHQVKKVVNNFKKQMAIGKYFKRNKNDEIIAFDVPAYICTKNIYISLKETNDAIKEDDNHSNEALLPFFEKLEKQTRELISDCIEYDKKLCKIIDEIIFSSTQEF